MATIACETCGADMDPRNRFCSDDCRPRCAVEDCARPRRKRQWCAGHYNQWRSTGAEPTPFAWTWQPAQPCLVCGQSGPDNEHRQFCSAACRRLYRTHDGDVPTSRHCVLCGDHIDLTAKGRGGQRRKASVKLCGACRTAYGDHGVTVEWLAERDGPACGICGDEVDLTLTRPVSLMCPSVDHVVPRAAGGTHEVDNLQLAHLLCNMRKGAAVPEGSVSHEPAHV